MLVKRAIEDERGLASEYTISDEALNAIVITAGGDARTALTTLELAAALTEPGGEIGHRASARGIAASPASL